jgi:hypothetical protein
LANTWFSISHLQRLPPLLASSPRHNPGKPNLSVNKQDHTVNPQPAADFARILHAPLLELDSDCGHRAHTCEMKRIGEAVAEFLEK